MANAVPRPWWWWDFITTPKLEFASLSSTGGTVGELLNAAMDPSINFDDLAEIRALWPHKIAIKGVQNGEDAKRLADLGVDAIVLSNHGGRQGVDRMIEILSEEIVRTMKLLQVTTLDELEPRHVTQLTRLTELTPRGIGERT